MIEKVTVIDIVCESQDGEKYLVEMQKCYRRSFQKRLLYYGSKMYAGQLKMGDVNYYEMKKFYVIDLSRFKKQINELTTPIDGWCFYLRNIHTLDKEEVDIFQGMYPFIEPAVRELERFHFNPEEQIDYMVYCMNNEKSNTIEELIADKVEDAKRDIAKKLLADGVSKDVVFKASGLKEEDLLQ